MARVQRQATARTELLQVALLVGVTGLNSTASALKAMTDVMTSFLLRHISLRGQSQTSR